LSSCYFRQQRRQHLAQVADHAEVGDAEDRGRRSLSIATMVRRAAFRPGVARAESAGQVEQRPDRRAVWSIRACGGHTPVGAACEPPTAPPNAAATRR